MAGKNMKKNKHGIQRKTERAAITIIIITTLLLFNFVSGLSFVPTHLVKVQDWSILFFQIRFINKEKYNADFCHLVHPAVIEA